MKKTPISIVSPIQPVGRLVPGRISGGLTELSIIQNMFVEENHTGAQSDPGTVDTRGSQSAGDRVFRASLC
jgi:hypothetical protein